MSKLITISKEFRFEASHVLPKHPGKCSQLHGHSWRLVVEIAGFVDPETGFVCDYADLSKLVKELIIDKVDHTHLGKGNACHAGKDSGVSPLFGEAFYPSSENLVVAFANILYEAVRQLPNHPRLHSISLDETCTSRATWRRSE